MRLGLFGGTFNPIHMGHVRAALKVKKEFGLDKINFIPASIPPHKEMEGMLDASDRFQMTRLAVESYPGFSVSDIELKRSGPSYTIDTVFHFKSVLAEDTELYLMMGFDAFLEINTWKSYQDLFLLIPLIVVARTDPDGGLTNLNRKRVEEYLRFRISKGYHYSPSQAGYIHKNKQPVFIFDITPVNIASTKIRQLVKKGISIRHMVPDKVKDYIISKGLYR